MPSARTRTLEDVLVSAIQRAPRRTLSKLALADLLTEKGLDDHAGALRWCARTRSWPQRRTGEDGNVWWQWWHPRISTTLETRTVNRGVLLIRPPHGPRTQPWAVLPRELLLSWPCTQMWSADTWLGALELLVRPLAGRGVLAPDAEGV